MNNKIPILIIAGEKSGEEHAQTFLPGLIEGIPNAHFFGVGGEYFQEKGVETLFGIEDFSTMGFSDALSKISFYIKARKKLLEEVKKRNCRYAILIDFQTFNLNIALKLKKIGVVVYYYVAPQAWAWKEWRVNQLKKAVDHLFCILPFETLWFKERGVLQTHQVIHPVYRKYEKELPLQADESNNVILFLPGSRNEEVKNHFPVFVDFIAEMKERYPEKYRYVFVQTDSVSKKYYDYYGEAFDDHYHSDFLPEALKESCLAIASSGTVTLTCGLFMVPTIVCYKVGLLNEFIFNQFIQYKGFVSLVNLVLNREVFPELLQHSFNKNSLLEHTEKFLDPAYRKESLESLQLLRRKFNQLEESVVDIIKGEVLE
ncbi:MAG: lipid-A-disaccharide synthase [Halobacteriovoraceae bacterium]|nr:lipid-A-disaccharide synthase [Halobacteriovoraceae bacterium]MCB9095476.1 lipid-A-disaccharide synthase [Halobacteriovoraceae bacterium]